MNSNYLKYLIGVLAVIGAQIAVGKTIYFGSGSETVPISYGTETILRFDEPVKMISNAADFIIKPASDENPDYAALTVEPRVMSGKADAVFILANGEEARLKLSVVPRESRVKTDSVYDIKSRKSLIESGADSAPNIGRLDLMTAMIRKDQVSGYEVSSLRRQVEGMRQAKVVLDRLYSGAEFKGYVYEIENLSPKNTLQVDIRRLEFGKPNQAVLAYSDIDQLGVAGSPTSKTRLIVVTKPAAMYRDAVLPVRVTTKPEKSGGAND
ncbi:MAG: hypothetical protein AB7T49_19885 [Oligoflexales bacterium]